jgi:hypothetical protein
MTYEQARKWLGLYFLLFSAALGGYVLLFAESSLLPLKRVDAGDAFKIVVPVLIGQVTVIFQWIGKLGQPNSDPCPIPGWAIKGPPIISVALVILGAAIMIAGNRVEGSGWGLSSDGFKSVLTFAISILNASTVFLVARLFPSADTTKK